MKDEIYTIPVTDAFTAHTECPICALRYAAKEKLLGFVLSPSYMELDVRDATNELGFCSVHATELYRRQNTLGVALMMQSHLMYIRKHLPEKAVPENDKKGLFKKKDPAEKKPFKKTCYVCDNLDVTYDRLLNCMFHLWSTNKDFKELFDSCGGFCTEHFNELYDVSYDKLSGPKGESFRSELFALEQKALDSLQEDVDWFIKKYDYQHRDAPWKNSKDAVPRVLSKMCSYLDEEALGKGENK